MKRLLLLLLVLLLFSITVTAQEPDTVGFADETGTLNAEIFPDDGFADTIRLYTAGANKELYSASIYTRSTSGTSTINLSLYDVSSGVDGGTLIAISDDISVSDNTNAWRSVDMVVPLTEGNIYMLMACNSGGAGNIVRNGLSGVPAVGVVEADGSCPSTLGTLDFTQIRMLAYGVIRNAAPGEADISYVRRIKEGEGK